jgi:hypothetical protein
MATAPEDVFLFKSVTDREDDLADMALLAGVALDWGAMVAELRSDVHNCRYLPHFTRKLEALEEVHGVVAPGRGGFEEEAEVMMGINVLDERVAEGPMTLEEATRHLGEGEEFSKTVLERMVDLGIVQEDNRLYRRVGEGR